MDACHYVHIDVILYHSGDLVPYDTQHKYINDPHHIPVDVRSEDSVKGGKIHFCKNNQYKLSLKSVCWQFSYHTWKAKYNC
jgi:hypothetical protein